MNVLCSAKPCPVLLSTTCVFYEGESLIYTGINTNDSVQLALQKIDEAFANSILDINAILPISVTAGPNPVISISQASAISNGFLSSTDWNIFNNKVPSSRTLTINGTTYDLSADRTWTIPSANIYNSDGTLTGNRTISSGGFSLTINPSTTFTENITFNGNLIPNSSPSGPNYLLGITRGTASSSLIAYTNQGLTAMQSIAFGYFTTTFSSQDIVFSSGTTSSKYFGQTTGNWTIGGTTDAGYKLDVNGTARVLNRLTVGNSSSAHYQTWFNGTTSTEYLAGSKFVTTYPFGTVSFGNLNAIPSPASGNKIGFQITNRNPQTLTFYEVDGANSQLFISANSTNTGSASAIVELQSTTQGFLQPRMTTTQRDAITSPATGLQVYNSTTNTNDYYNGTSWLSEGNVSGSGVSGQVSYWNGTSSQTGSNNLFWDAANSRLGIGTNAPVQTLHSNGSTYILGSDATVALQVRPNAAVSSAFNTFEVLTTAGAQQFVINRNGPVSSIGQITIAGQNIYRAGDILFRTSAPADNGIIGITTQETGSTTLGFTSSLSRKFTFSHGIYSLGNTILGSTTSDGGQRLQVIGDAFIKGSGATSATTALQVQNSGGSNLLRFRNDGSTIIGSSIQIYPYSSSAFTVDSAGRFVTIQYAAYGGASSGYGVYLVNSGAANREHTSGDGGTLALRDSFTVASGTGTFNVLNIIPTINQTGGANGITRGLYVNPTLTAAADWRSIEWSNNSGWGLYGAGTANNYLGGKLSIVKNESSVFDGVSIQNTSNANQATTIFRAKNELTGVCEFGLFSNGTIGANAGVAFFYTNQNILDFYANGGNRMRIYGATGNVVLQNGGTFADAGYRLDVNGTFRAAGSSFSIQTNSEGRVGIGVAPSPSHILNVTGQAIFNSQLTSGFQFLCSFIRPFGVSEITIYTSSNPTYGVTFWQSYNDSDAFTTGTRTLIRAGITFNPTSGTAVRNQLLIDPIINQTGGASGISRGIYLNPTLTAAADWRSIEMSNNSGWGIYQSGASANNYLAGKLLIGLTSPSTYALDVNGTARVSGAMTISAATTGSSAYTFTVSDTNSSIGSTIYMPFSTQGLFIQARLNGSRIYSLSGYNYLGFLNNSNRLVLGGNETQGAVTGVNVITNSTTYGNGFGLAIIDEGGPLGQGSGINFYSAAVSRNTAGIWQEYGSVYSNVDMKFLVSSSSTLSEAMRIFGSTKNLGINTTADIASAQLHINSTTKGFLPPRMTTTQKNAISTPAAGLQVYDATLNLPSYYNGTAWVDYGFSIYNSNGTLTGNRTVSSGGFDLSFTSTTHIGTSVIGGGGSGKLIVGSSTADNGIQIFGNNPSLRIDNAQSGGSQRFVIGNATSANNFIQGSVAGQFCIATASVGALLFGMWNGTNSSEVMRITTLFNLHIGGTGDTGQKFQVTGDARITGTIFQDSTTDSLFNFQNSGANKWRIGNAYVSGSNYFQLYDSVNNLERIRWNNDSTATFTSDITFIGNSNAVATFQSAQPDIKIQATGASNPVSLSFVPSNGFEGVIQNNVTNGFVQVKTASTTRVTFKNGGQVNFQPLAADPAGAGAGDVYYNSGTNKLRLYDGTSWVDLN